MGRVKWMAMASIAAGFAMFAGARTPVMSAQERGGAEVTRQYEYVENWPLPVHDDGWTWGSIPAVWAESEDRVLVFMRGEKPAMMKDVPARGDIKGRALGLLSAVLEQGRQQSRFDGTPDDLSIAAAASSTRGDSTRTTSPTAAPTASESAHTTPNGTSGSSSISATRSSSSPTMVRSW